MLHFQPWRIACVAFGSLASSACSSPSQIQPVIEAGPLDASSEAEAGPSQVTNITVSTGDLVPAFSTSVYDYEVSSLTTMFPVLITVSGQDTLIAGQQAKDGVA